LQSWLSLWSLFLLQRTPRSVQGQQGQEPPAELLNQENQANFALDGSMNLRQNSRREGGSAIVLRAAIPIELVNRMRVGACLLLITCLVAVPAAARDIYVSNTQGDDHNNGNQARPLGERRGPYRTIARALRSAENGDTIVIENSGEPYHESLTLQAARHSGFAGKPFTILGNGAVLDGSEPVLAEAWEAYENDVFRFPVERKSFHILNLNGKPATRRFLEEGEDKIPELAPLEWCLHDGHVYFCVEKGKLPWSYELSHTVLPVGITFYEVHDVLVQELTVQGFALDGVNAHDGAVRAELVGLTCRSNGRSGISVGGASKVTIDACLVGNNGAAQVRTEGYCQARIVNCELIDDPRAPAVDKQGGSVTVEPRVAKATVSDEELLR